MYKVWAELYDENDFLAWRMVGEKETEEEAEELAEWYVGEEGANVYVEEARIPEQAYDDLDVRVRKQAAMQVTIDGDELKTILDALKDGICERDMLPFESEEQKSMMTLHDKLIAVWREKAEVVA